MPPSPPSKDRFCLLGLFTVVYRDPNPLLSARELTFTSVMPRLAGYGPTDPWVMQHGKCYR